MALTHEQQAVELISRAKNILILTPERASTDTLSAAVAVALLAKKLQKNADIVSPGRTGAWPSFLPEDVSIKPEIGTLRSFHVHINVKDVPLSELMYDIKEGVLDITLVPKTGAWTSSDVTVKHGEERYDLIIALGAADLLSIGKPAQQQADFFYRTTIINIDHRTDNEYWGQVNLVDLNAVSSTEVIYGWLERWNIQLIDESIATCLLAGMIAETKSFRTPNVTPKTLAASSTLVGMGAKREHIVHGLWRTHSVNTLKLWGRALSRLEEDHELGLIWTRLTEADFLEAGVDSEALQGVVDELLTYAPEARAIAVITQQKEDVLVHIHAHPPLSAIELARPLGGRGTRDEAECILHKAGPLTEASTHIIENLRQTLRLTRK